MKVLIVDEMHECILPLLEKQGHEVNYVPTITKDEVLEIIEEYEGIVVRSKLSFDKHFFQQAKKLKFIARAGAGLDQIDLEEVERRKIQLFNAPEGNRDAVGEHTLAMLLLLLNNLKKGSIQIKKGIWDREGNRGYELSARTVGIIGYGNMGRAFAQRVKPMGCEVLAYDKYKTNYSDEFAREASLEELFEKCDVVSLHIPLTEETNHWINSAFFKQFHHPFWLLNTARGKVCMLDSVLKMLEEGQILGAGLDVLENEKFDQLNPSERAKIDKLSSYDNVLLSPHVGGWTFESYEKISKVLAEKINDVF
ncbi:MAG: phosphoglycerate dehydrogenase [Cytophagales bacterium]|nr:phosphoglycerate dehydrogenase [Cytophagales bacterium]